MTTSRKHTMRVIISGCCGRMGSRLVALVHQSKDLMLLGAMEAANHPCLGHDVGECTNMGRVGVHVASSWPTQIRRGDVLIEFSSPEATTVHLVEAVRRRCPVVIGTTGLTRFQVNAVRGASRRIPIIMAPNMSAGMSVLYQLAEQATKMLGDAYDIEIIETHHAGKKDAPSGTAKRLADVLAHARQHDISRVAVYGRRGDQPRRSHHEIGVHAVRAGDVVGDHQVIFASAGERLELTHRASSRDTFAHGALRAARFLVRQRPGLYDMRDVLGLR